MNKSLVNVEPETVYYNITIPFQPDSSGLSPAIYQEQLNQPIVYDPSTYFLSIVRFQISASFIPIFIARILPYPNTDRNKTIYSVTLSYNGVYSPQTYVEYVPVNNIAPMSLPLTPSHPVVDYTPYYYVYLYTDFLTMVNTALATAFTALAGLTTLPTGTVPLVAPYFIYNPDTTKISLIAQQQFYDQSLPLPINIFINTQMFHFFDGIPVIYDSDFSTNGRDVMFNVSNLNDSNWYFPTGPLLPYSTDGATLLQMEQQYNILGNWNSLRAIQLISNLLPINREYVASNNTQSGIISAQGILADFIPFVSLGPEARSSVEFEATGPWRLIDMFGHYPITKVDLTFYWTDELGVQNIIYIPNNQNASVKLVFMKKSLFSGSQYANK